MLAQLPLDHDPLLPPMPVEVDLFGRVLQDCYRGVSSEYYLRRDDGRLDRDSSARYFRSWDVLPEHQRCLLGHARGRVLDVGAGAGQHALALQQRGLEVLAIDCSPLAIEVCRARGVQQARVMDGLRLALTEHSFDSVLLLGNNIGLAGTPDGLRVLLRQLRRIVRPGGQILAEFTDYTATYDAANLRYHARNIARNRYPGSVALRIEYQGRCSLPFDWLLPKLGDLRRICAETGWQVTRCLQVMVESTYAIVMALG